MDKLRLERRLRVAYGRLICSKTVLFAASEQVITHNRALEEEKSKAEASGQFDGKNAETRKAQSSMFFADRTLVISHLEATERRARFEVDICQLRVDAYRALLRVHELDHETKLETH